MGWLHKTSRRYGGPTYTQPSFFESLGRIAGGVRRNQPGFFEGISQRYTGPPNRNSFLQDMALRYSRPKSPHMENCPDCSGHGRHSGVTSHEEICPNCGGVFSGTTCEECGGGGAITVWQNEDEICGTCHGDGSVIEWRRNYEIRR